MKIEVDVEGINMPLAYLAPDDVKIGDTVIVPVVSLGGFDDDERTGVVARLESDYDGHCKHICKVMTPN